MCVREREREMSRPSLGVLYDALSGVHEVVTQRLPVLLYNCNDGQINWSN